MTDNEMCMSAGDTDLTVQGCEGGQIEITVSDGVDEMYAQLDLDDVERLIGMLRQAAADARRLQQG
jgi:hypothetical protein